MKTNRSSRHPLSLNSRNQRRKATRARRGFTLLEVLLVLIILVVIAGFAIQNFAGIQDTANKKAATTQITQLSTAIKTYQLLMNALPPNLEALVNPPADLAKPGDWPRGVALLGERQAPSRSTHPRRKGGVRHRAAQVAPVTHWEQRVNPKVDTRFQLASKAASLGTAVPVTVLWVGAFASQPSPGPAQAVLLAMPQEPATLATRSGAGGQALACNAGSSMGGTGNACGKACGGGIAIITAVQGG